MKLTNTLYFLFCGLGNQQYTYVSKLRICNVGGIENFVRFIIPNELVRINKGMYTLINLVFLSRNDADLLKLSY
jgi:hypothetical protein